MDLVDQLRTIAGRAGEQADGLATEEATKNALVMPFINALGYNVFDPTEVVPEYTADVGIKKGEKVDYVIMREGTPAILIECKTVGTPLDTAVMSQLFRYFTVTEARFAICTDGIRYRFFSDLEKPNRMDEKPFLDFDLLHMRPEVIEQLKKLSKPHFDQDAILATASDLKYTREIKRILAQQMEVPDEDVVRLMVGRVTSARFTQAVREQFEILVRNAFREFIRDNVQDRLKSALDETVEPKPATTPEVDAAEANADSDVVTTAEELEGFFIVKAILRERIEAHRVVARDVRTYFGILLDDNNRKPLARLWFKESSKYLGLFDNEEKREDRVRLESLDDIYNYRDRLLATPAFYDVAQTGPQAEPEPHGEPERGTA